jgi:hypothetical protein
VTGDDLPEGMVPYGPDHPAYPYPPADWDRTRPVKRRTGGPTLTGFFGGNWDHATEADSPLGKLDIIGYKQKLGAVKAAVRHGPLLVSWNYHLVQIGEHIDAMERWAATTDGVQRRALDTSINRMRDRVAASKLVDRQ